MRDESSINGASNNKVAYFYIKFDGYGGHASIYYHQQIKKHNNEINKSSKI